MSISPPPFVFPTKDAMFHAAWAFQIWIEPRNEKTTVLNGVMNEFFFLLERKSQDYLKFDDTLWYTVDFTLRQKYLLRADIARQFKEDEEKCQTFDTAVCLDDGFYSCDRRRHRLTNSCLSMEKTFNGQRRKNGKRFQSKVSSLWVQYVRWYLKNWLFSLDRYTLAVNAPYM